MINRKRTEEETISRKINLNDTSRKKRAGKKQKAGLFRTKTRWFASKFPEWLMLHEIYLAKAARSLRYLRECPC